MDFTWIPIYRELARKILDYRYRREDLVKILKELREQKLPVIRLMDRIIKLRANHYFSSHKQYLT